MSWFLVVATIRHSPHESQSEVEHKDHANDEEHEDD